jgi:hypothetical protein
MLKTQNKILFLLDGIPVETLDASKVSMDQVDFIKQGLAIQFGAEVNDIDIRHVTIIEKTSDEFQNAIYFLRVLINNRLLWSFNLN